MANPDRRATPEDIAEFGGHELAGAPSIAALIACFPEGAREAYRNERRAMLRQIDPTARSWREYFEARARG